MTSRVQRGARARLERNVARTLGTFQMAQPGDLVLVALSGGPDSTALLLCLQSLAPGLGLSISAAHLNHKLRGPEADGDEAFCRELCARLGIPFRSEALEIGKRAAAARMNLEEAGRKARFAFLRRAAEETGAARVALGHTINDQAETVLMRLFRGSGVEGLSGIHPMVDGLFIRPLLECSRDEILRYLAAMDEAYREDSTNLDLDFRRNRVRRELIPYLEKWFNPSIVAALARHARLSREVADYLRSATEEAFERVRGECAEGVALHVERLLELPLLLQKTTLRLALERLSGTSRAVASSHLDEILSLCGEGQSGKRIVLPGKRFAFRQFGLLLVGEGDRPVAPRFSYELHWPGTVPVPELGLEVVASVGSPPQRAGKTAGSDLALLDAQTIPRKLYVRSRLPGDRYGGPRRRKVKRMLIDAQVPLLSRATLPMVATEDSVLWIPGFRPARTAALRIHSRRCLTLEIRRRVKLS